ARRRVRKTMTDVENLHLARDWRARGDFSKAGPPAEVGGARTAQCVRRASVVCQTATESARRSPPGRSARPSEGGLGLTSREREKRRVECGSSRGRGSP